MGRRSWEGDSPEPVSFTDFLSHCLSLALWWLWMLGSLQAHGPSQAVLPTTTSLFPPISGLTEIHFLFFPEPCGLSSKVLANDLLDRNESRALVKSPWEV